MCRHLDHRHQDRKMWRSFVILMLIWGFEGPFMTRVNSTHLHGVLSKGKISKLEESLFNKIVTKLLHHKEDLTYSDNNNMAHIQAHNSFLHHHSPGYTTLPKRNFVLVVKRRPIIANLRRFKIKHHPFSHDIKHSSTLPKKPSFTKLAEFGPHFLKHNRTNNFTYEVTENVKEENGHNAAVNNVFNHVLNIINQSPLNYPAGKWVDSVSESPDYIQNDEGEGKFVSDLKKELNGSHTLNFHLDKNTTKTQFPTTINYGKSGLDVDTLYSTPFSALYSKKRPQGPRTTTESKIESDNYNGKQHLTKPPFHQTTTFTTMLEESNTVSTNQEHSGPAKLYFPIAEQSIPDIIKEDEIFLLARDFSQNSTKASLQTLTTAIQAFQEEEGRLETTTSFAIVEQRWPDINGDTIFSFARDFGQNSSKATPSLRTLTTASQDLQEEEGRLETTTSFAIVQQRWPDINGDTIFSFARDFGQNSSKATPSLRTLTTASQNLQEEEGRLDTTTSFAIVQQRWPDINGDTIFSFARDFGQNSSKATASLRTLTTASQDLQEEEGRLETTTSFSIAEQRWPEIKGDAILPLSRDFGKSRTQAILSWQTLTTAGRALQEEEGRLKTTTSFTMAEQSMPNIIKDDEIFQLGSEIGQSTTKANYEENHHLTAPFYQTSPFTKMLQESNSFAINQEPSGPSKLDFPMAQTLTIASQSLPEKDRLETTMSFTIGEQRDIDDDHTIPLAGDNGQSTTNATPSLQTLTAANRASQEEEKLLETMTQYMVAEDPTSSLTFPSLDLTPTPNSNFQDGDPLEITTRFHPYFPVTEHNSPDIKGEVSLLARDLSQTSFTLQTLRTTKSVFQNHSGLIQWNQHGVNGVGTETQTYIVKDESTTTESYKIESETKENNYPWFGLHAGSNQQETLSPIYGDTVITEIIKLPPDEITGAPKLAKDSPLNYPIPSIQNTVRSILTMPVNNSGTASQNSLIPGDNEVESVTSNYQPTESTKNNENETKWVQSSPAKNYLTENISETSISIEKLRKIATVETAPPSDIHSQNSPNFFPTLPSAGVESSHRRSDVGAPEDKDEEADSSLNLSEDELYQMIPVIIEELRQNNITPEEKEILSGIYGDFWFDILHIADTKDLPAAELIPDNMLNKEQSHYQQQLPKVLRRKVRSSDYLEVLSDYFERSKPEDYSSDEEESSKSEDSADFTELLDTAQAHRSLKTQRLRVPSS